MKRLTVLSRAGMLVGASLGSLVVAQAAFAQDATGANAPANAEDTAPIVVTGTRLQRTALDTAAPVDVISVQTLKEQGTTELATALATVTPSIDFPRPSVTDGTDAIRPATLRGLSPDQTLVLINGVRAHTSALLNVNGSVGRGSAAVDLNTIPSTALQSIEVLRDGASAQYGSDAIAGVVNLRLREARSGGGATVTYGFYDTQVDTARTSRHVTGESSVTAAGWQGIGLGSDGFLTLSGEYTHRNPTSRGDLDPRLASPKVDSRFGDPEVDSYTVYANAGKPVGDSWELYGWAGYQYRDTKSAAFPRTPSSAAGGGVSSIYPDGFLPLINTKSSDLTATGGLRGDLGGWNVDINVSYGRNKIKFNTLNSANYSLGTATPLNFYDGALTYDQWVGGVDVSQKFDVFQSLNVAFGIEGRSEGYKIEAGELASYSGSGAQGFPGFSPNNNVSRHRRNGSIYLDLEAQVTDKFMLGIAGRGEDYSDFGTTATGKVSARYDFSPSFAIRGTASTGFRAPSLQQEYFTSIASVVQDGNVILTGQFPSVAPVAAALGGLPLEPEKSTNLSAGFVVRSGGFNMTVDGYWIHVRDQLGLSENIQGTFSPDVAALLAPYNVKAARFFINGLASTSKGIDVVANYRVNTASAGTFDLSVAGNVNQVEVTHVPTTTSTLDPAPTLFARSRVLAMEVGTPGEKVTGSIVWKKGMLGATARVTYYGNVIQPGTTAVNDNYVGKHAITDLEARYGAGKGLNLALGVNNLFDVYPDQVPASRNGSGVVAFPFFSPFGFNGRFLYVRAGLSW
ncbi:TonB-dependent receptor [Novosphingobium sp. ZN18A2]|uniref:TonB-dependent receptor plug domain-containing protein n=1 Tax=Novosphingobium sp. ZN18A2 TaxID=3079861 RepID=UPI0030D2FCA5